MSTTDTPRPGAMSAAREIGETCVIADGDHDPFVFFESEACARIIERELAAAQAKIANQSERIRYLEGATNHATGTPLSQAQAKIAALESQLEAHAWTISPAMAQAQIDALNAKIAELERALDFNLQGNRESVARIEQLEREPAAALATIAELQTLADNQAEEIERLLADKARLDWLEDNAHTITCMENVAGNVTDYFIDTTRAAIDAARKEGQP